MNHILAQDDNTPSEHAADNQNETDQVVTRAGEKFSVKIPTLRRDSKSVGQYQGMRSRLIIRVLFDKSHCKISSST